MEGSRKPRKLRESCVRRQFEANRLEELVWAMAYEEVWPIVRRALRDRTKPSAADKEDSQPGARVAVGA